MGYLPPAYSPTDRPPTGGRRVQQNPAFLSVGVNPISLPTHEVGRFVVDPKGGAWFAMDRSCAAHALPIKHGAQDRSEAPKRWRHEGPGTAAADRRVLPAHRTSRIDLRPPRGQRRQAHRAIA